MICCVIPELIFFIFNSLPQWCTLMNMGSTLLTLTGMSCETHLSALTAEGSSATATKMGEAFFDSFN